MPETSIEKIPQQYVGLIASNTLWDTQEGEDAFPSGFSQSNTWIVSEYNPKKVFVYTNTPVVDFTDNTLNVLVYFSCQDPITNKDLLNCDEDEVQELIYQIKMSVSINNRTIIANRLLELYQYSKEEGPDTVGISTESLRNFVGFLQNNNMLKCPEISLTPDYNIYVSWKDDRGQVFSVHFLHEKDVRFVLFKTNYRHPERKIRISGAATSDVLMETLSPHRIYNWVIK